MPRDIQQQDVVAALRSPASWPGSPDRVDVIETHAAFVFMAGNEVLKVKRAVRLLHLDFTALETRLRVCQREIELNAPHAPGLYRDVIAIRRRDDGTFVIGGCEGEVVEWAVRMSRFSQEDLLSSMCARGALSPEIVKGLSDRIFAYHNAAHRVSPAAERTSEVAHEVLTALGRCIEPPVQTSLEKVAEAFERALALSASVRAERVEKDCIRRCHGDLHLGNIIMWQGEPMPFGALEFDAQLANIDTLYDLALLLMDLDRWGHRISANILLNRYLWRSGDLLNIRSLAALPVFLGLSACVRAMMACDRLDLATTDRAKTIAHVVETLTHAAHYFSPPPPRLVAIGGLSGTGKTTLAAKLAPQIGAVPGALHLRTDLERRWLAGLDELDRLPPAAYSDRVTRATYERVTARAAAALAAGHGVVVDGVFAAQSERAAVAGIAYQAGVPFRGLWLEAAPEAMKSRINRCIGEASDTTNDIVDRQLAHLPRVTDWTHIDANGPQDDVSARARAALGANIEKSI
jgi:uncharacterized protein